MSLRPFIGCKDYQVAREFYKTAGFEEYVVSKDMSNFSRDDVSFYLQDAYVKDWIDNTMIFWEVENVEAMLKELKDRNLTAIHPRVKISKIHYQNWGKEFFMHDPSGVLWHIGAFSS